MERFEEYTQRISLTEALLEYCRNEEFRNCLDSENIVYVDNAFVFNLPDIVYSDNGKLVLADGIDERLESCALSFGIELIFELERGFGKKDKFVGGKIKKQKRFDLKLTKKNLATSDKISPEIKQEWLAQIEMFDIKAQYEQSCWWVIGQKLKKIGTYPEDFERKTLLPQRYFFRCKNDKNEVPPSIRTIVAIATGYDFDLAFAEEVLKLAGHALSPAIPEHMAYRFLLKTMQGSSIQEKNAVLRSSGFKPLGVTSDEDEEDEE